MLFKKVGINLSGNHLGGGKKLVESLMAAKASGPDFVEVCPHNLGTILGGKPDPRRTKEVEETLAAAELDYTVHAPHRMNLMDLSSLDLHRGALESSIRFAGEIGAGVVVCHAGQRFNARDARYSFKEQLAAERSTLRRAGEIAGNLGVTIAVENSYPEPPILTGERYAYAVRPAELAEQVSDVDHPAVGMCLDVGHAFVAAGFYGFDFVRECAETAPLVRHVHLHDNLGQPDADGEIRASERHAYGLGDLHLPPGRGTIPLERLLRTSNFAQPPTCCVELLPDLSPLSVESLRAARELGARSAARVPVGR